MAGIDAFGTKLLRANDAATPVFTAIANVTNISPPGLSRETYDTTAHDTPGGWQTHIGGLKDGGEVTIDINFMPATQTVLLQDLDDALPRSFQIQFPVEPGKTQPSVWSVSAILTGFEPDAPYDGLLTASLTWKISGKPTFTAGS